MIQDYATTIHPCGRVLKLVMLSTWGDPHYIGLNGLEILSASGLAIPLTATQLSAEPPSIASLPQQSTDPRTVDKLIDGSNSTYDDRHMFLAPFTPGKSNSVRVDLGHAEVIGAVRIWNYAKTSTRGARSFEIFLDGSLLYQGTARPAPLRQGREVSASADFVQTVLFTDNEEIIREEAAHVYTQEDLEDGLQIFDNGRKVAGSSGRAVEEILRPATSVVGAAPPTARRGHRAPLAGQPLPPQLHQAISQGLPPGQQAAYPGFSTAYPAASSVARPRDGMPTARGRDGGRDGMPSARSAAALPRRNDGR